MAYKKAPGKLPQAATVPEKLHIRRCSCGHPGCTAYRIAEAGAEGMFDEHTARRIAAAFNATRKQTLAQLEARVHMLEHPKPPSERNPGDIRKSKRSPNDRKV